MSTIAVGWIGSLAGMALWLYGYLAADGAPPFIAWHGITPWWIADFLPNKQSEIGMGLCLVSLFPLYWPRSKSSR